MTPAWKSSDLAPVGVLDWHASTCAMCGETRRTVLDHCHATGLVRGYLCRRCNAAETNSTAEHWQAWRAWDNPARALNSPVTYEEGWGFDATPLHPGVPLSYADDTERRAWWAEQVAAAERGDDWPTAYISSPAAVQRHEDEWQRMCAAAIAIPGASA
jgi:hypothetical protein